MTTRPPSRPSAAADRDARLRCRFGPESARRAWPILALATALAVLAGCRLDSAQFDAPGVQKLTWFAYLDADDLRHSCGPGRPDSYRLIYNAHYAEQVRTYEIQELPAGGGVLEAAAQEGSGIAVSARFVSFSDPFASWAWRRDSRPLGAEELAALRGALAESGALAPPPVGLRLRSNAFYWIAAGCLEGRPFYHAWLFDEGGFAGLRFPARLYALDRTGVAAAPPRRRDPAERTSANTPPRQSGSVARVPYFVVQVGEDGLVGQPPF